jgi:hypothetical protein
LYFVRLVSAFNRSLHIIQQRIVEINHRLLSFENLSIWYLSGIAVILASRKLDCRFLLQQIDCLLAVLLVVDLLEQDALNDVFKGHDADDFLCQVDGVVKLNIAALYVAV